MIHEEHGNAAPSAIALQKRRWELQYRATAGHIHRSVTYVIINVDLLTIEHESELGTLNFCEKPAPSPRLHFNNLRGFA